MSGRGRDSVGRVERRVLVVDDPPDLVLLEEVDQALVAVAVGLEFRVGEVRLELVVGERPFELVVDVVGIVSGDWHAITHISDRLIGVARPTRTVTGSSTI